jgi:hypothetical protein
MVDLPTDSIGEECGSHDALHAPQRRPDGGVETRDPQMVQEQELCSHHVLYRHHGEIHSIAFTCACKNILVYTVNLDPSNFVLCHTSPLIITSE